MTDLAKLKELKRIAETADYLLPKYRAEILDLISRLEEAEKAAEVERKNGELAATIYKEQRDEAVGALGRALEVISGVYAMNLLDATAAGQKIIFRFFMDGEQLFNPPAFYREARKIIDEGHAQGVVARIKGGE